MDAETIKIICGRRTQFAVREGVLYFYARLKSPNVPAQTVNVGVKLEGNDVFLMQDTIAESRFMTADREACRPDWRGIFLVPSSALVIGG